MKKYKEDGKGCMSCFGANFCPSWRRQLKTIPKYNACAVADYKYYANKTETESLLENYKHIPRGSREDLTFCCPKCGSADCMMAPDTEVGRLCCKCDTLWFADKDHTEKLASEDLDFRVGDPAWTASLGNLEIYEIDEKRIYTHPVGMEHRNIAFMLDGRSVYEMGEKILFHGHDLEATVKEKMPVRTITQYETVYKHPVTSKLEIKISGKDKGYVIPKGWEAVYGPVEVQIPE